MIESFWNKVELSFVLHKSDNNDVGSVGQEDENKGLKESITEIIDSLKQVTITKHTQFEKQLRDSKSKLETKLHEVTT